MKIAIDILKEQVKLSQERLSTNYYPESIEPLVRLKIADCQNAIIALDFEMIRRKILLGKA